MRHSRLERLSSTTAFAGSALLETSNATAARFMLTMIDAGIKVVAPRSFVVSSIARPPCLYALVQTGCMPLGQTEGNGARCAGGQIAWRSGRRRSNSRLTTA